ncbi:MULTISPECIES: aldo/keto reductase [Terrabacteria group]|uniref:aldo/keto reductase family protein n=1 Tax=Bacillati TaxID=1783272 RepID=UPI00193A6107|nr:MULTISPECIES: aldo/keto reductase [Terrabacteria group]MBW9212957.1 aldo/keto reductase [Trueperella sp. zg.1013]QRG87017.1 aldo/keto reductase [Bulleidia sp. zg-1006]
MKTAFRITNLHNGIIIPYPGYRIDHTRANSIYKDVLKALTFGFRHLDLPSDSTYFPLIQKAIEESHVHRDDLFLTAKLGNHDHGTNGVKRYFGHLLKIFKTDYIDLFLINWPNPLEFRKNHLYTEKETWFALEDLYRSGKVHAIGIGNCQAHHIEEYLEFSNIAPMVNQARFYPGFPFENNLDCAKLHGIQTIGFLPPNHEAILKAKEIQIFANKYHVSTRMICARYLLDKDVLPLVQSNDLNEMEDYSQLHSFQLAKEDIKFLDGIQNYGPANINPDTCDF